MLVRGVGPSWQYTQEYVQTFSGRWLTPRLRPKRRETMGPKEMDDTPAGWRAGRHGAMTDVTDEKLKIEN